MRLEHQSQGLRVETSPHAADSEGADCRAPDAAECEGSRASGSVMHGLVVSKLNHLSGSVKVFVGGEVVRGEPQPCSAEGSTDAVGE